MAKVSSPFIAPVHGVSQQDPTLVPEGYLKEQVNMISDPIKGLYRRPGTELIRFIPKSSKNFIDIVEHNQIDYEVRLTFNNNIWELRLVNLSSLDEIAIIITDSSMIDYLNTLETPKDLILVDFQDVLYIISRKKEITTSIDTHPIQYDWKTNTISRFNLDFGTSNIPSFLANSPIQDLLFVQNRTVFINEKGIFMSKTNNLNQFYPDDATIMTAADPILLLVAQSGDKLQFIVPFSETFIIFGLFQQYSVYFQGALTLENLTILPATTFTIQNTRPSKAGSEVFFVSNNNEYTKVQKYIVAPDTQIKTAFSLTSNIPKYIPKNIEQMIYLESHDVLILFTKETPNTLYILQQAYQGNQQIQLAWHKWKFKYNIQSIGKSSDDVLYILFDLGTNLAFTRLNLANKPKFYLDFYEKNTGLNEPGVYFMWNFEQPSPFLLIGMSEGGVSFPDAERQYILVDEKNYSEGTSDNFTYSGIPFESYIELQPWILRNSQGQPVTDGRLQLRQIELIFTDTWYLKVVNTPLGRPEYYREYQNLTLDGYEIPGEYNQDTLDYISESRGVLKTYIGGQANKANLKITSGDSMWRMGILGYTLFGNWQQFSKWSHGTSMGNGGV